MYRNKQCACTHSHTSSTRKHAHAHKQTVSPEHRTHSRSSLIAPPRAPDPSGCVRQVREPCEGHQEQARDQRRPQRRHAPLHAGGTARAGAHLRARHWGVVRGSTCSAGSDVLRCCAALLWSVLTPSRAVRGWAGNRRAQGQTGCQAR